MKSINKGLLSVAMIAALSTTSLVQAEGWFSNLLGGGDKSTTAKGASFTQMLAYVPADTSYLITNQKTMPDEVVAFQLQRTQQALEILKPSKSNKDDKAADFFGALIEDIGKNIADKSLEKTGLSLKSHNVLYGMNTFPVMRMGIADKKAVLETLKRAEKKSDFKLELTQCEQLDCFVKTDKKGKSTIAIVFLKEHIAASFFPTDKKEEMLKHLTGKTSPKDAYTEKNWEKFLSENEYVGFGDGFINLQKLVAKIKPLLLEKEKNAKACLAVAEDHLENMPELLIGTKELRKDSMKYEFLVKTSETVSTTLQSIANKKNIAQRAENPIFDIALNINFMKLRSALTQYLGFLATSGEKHKCKEISPKEIRKATGGIAMAMNMGLSQFKSIYIALNDLDLDDKMQPKNIDLIASIGTEDPMGLVNMLALVNPAFMTLKIPADGKAIKIPASLIPSNNDAIPPIYLSRGEKKLNIMVGNDKPALIDYKNTTPEILSVFMDEKRYYKKISKILKVLPTADDKQEQEAAKMLESISGMMGKGIQTIRADKRGLVIEYHVQY